MTSSHTEVALWAIAVAGLTVAAVVGAYQLRDVVALHKLRKRAIDKLALVDTKALGIQASVALNSVAEATFTLHSLSRGADSSLPAIQRAESARTHLQDTLDNLVQPMRGIVLDALRPEDEQKLFAMLELVGRVSRAEWHLENEIQRTIGWLPPFRSR